MRILLATPVYDEQLMVSYHASVIRLLRTLPKAWPGLAFDHDRLQHLDVALRAFLTAEAGAVQQLHERQGRPVEDRQFRTVDLDHGVGHAQRGEGGHQVLDGRQRRAGGVADHGVQARVDHRLA